MDEHDTQAHAKPSERHTHLLMTHNTEYGSPRSESRRDNLDEYDNTSEARERHTHRGVVVNVAVGDCGGAAVDMQATALCTRG